MKTIQEIQGSYSAFEKRFGVAVAGADQGSEIWFMMKLGVLSSSNASKILAKRDTDTRWTYLCEMVAQIATGQNQPEFSAAAIDWGRQHEDAARAYYELQTGHKLTPVSFIFKDDSYHEGCSPDAFVTGLKPAEIKVPYNSANYIKFLLDDEIKSEWEKQAQYQMRVIGSNELDFCMYDPRMKTKPMKIRTFHRDEKIQKQFDEAVPLLIEDLGAALSKIGMKFGDQWSRLKASNAG